MAMIEQPSDEALRRLVRTAKDAGQCLYAVPEDGQWLPIENYGPLRESANGEYYEVFPISGKILRCAVGTNAVLERVWWSDIKMREYQRERVALIFSAPERLDGTPC